ncbi:MAG: helix-turn-helix transcriptional regulator [Prevotella sp.]
MNKNDRKESSLRHRRPKLMDMTAMDEILRPYEEGGGKPHFFLNNEIGMMDSTLELFRIVTQQKAPFVINDHRFGLVTHGEMDTNLNLVDRHLRAGMIAYLAPGTIINPICFSDDLGISGIALFEDFPMPFPPDKMPSAFNGHVRDFVLPVSDSDLLTIRLIFDALWHVVSQPDYPRAVVSSLVAALMHHYNALYLDSSEHQALARTREQTIFDRFIQLVNLHSHEHHHIGYYASRMCLSGRYLTTIIHQTSGVTAKEWIDRALISRIQVELIHTAKPVAQIADELHFPNPSFFCKYFKRITGVTPGEYRQRR